MENTTYNKKIDFEPEITFIKKTHEKNITTVCSQIDHTYRINDVYTDRWDLLRISDSYGEWQIPFIQPINNKERLAALLWMTYDRDIETRIVQSQAEYYTIERERNRKKKGIIFPLRIPWKDKWPDPEPKSEFDLLTRLTRFSWPTFQLDYGLYRKLHQILFGAFAIHFFTYYDIFNLPENIGGGQTRTEIMAMQFTYPLASFPCH